MKFVSDRPTAVKIRKMKQRVRWQESAIVERGIDQTQMVFEDNWADSPEFSFLVLGDSGAGPHRGHNPQRQIAELMLANSDACRFILHTGDVIYLVGSSEYYRKNFIDPYREFLVGGEQPERITYDKMVFTLPFLPVLGNHDYYDLPFFYGLMAGTTLPLRRLLKSRLDLDIGWHGSFQGNAYAQAFLDYLKAFDPKEELGRHLDRHYILKKILVAASFTNPDASLGYRTAITRSVAAGLTSSHSTRTLSTSHCRFLRLEKGKPTVARLKNAGMTWSSKNFKSLKPPQASALTDPTRLNNSTISMPSWSRLKR